MQIIGISLICVCLCSPYSKSIGSFITVTLPDLGLPTFCHSLLDSMACVFKQSSSCDHQNLNKSFFVLGHKCLHSVSVPLQYVH